MFFNRLFSMLGLARPDPRRMPKPYGAIRIRPRLGVNANTYFKFLRKEVMPFLTKKDEKVLRAHYKALEPGDPGWIWVMVGEKAYKGRYNEDLKCKITVEHGEDIKCGCSGRFFKGCCNGPRVGGEDKLEKSYYIREYLGVDEWPDNTPVDNEGCWF